MLGQYIVVEGLDLSGKDTLIHEIVKEYKVNRRNFIVVREPNDLNNEMKEIRQIIKEDKFNTATQIELLIYQRTFLLKEHIIPALENGFDVISNRNFLTSCSYQQSQIYSVQDIFKKNMGIRVLERPGRRWAMPDVMVFLDIDHDTYKERLMKRNEELDIQDLLIEDPDVFNRRRNNYHEALELLNANGVRDIIVNPPSIGELMRRLWTK